MWSVAPAVRRLSAELASHGLPTPVVYASDGFFAKDGRFAIAVPFHLLSAWLVEVERSIMGEVEGESTADLLRLLRHEAAHALDSRLSLFRTPTYRQAFGNFHRPYPAHYRPDLASDKFVRHLPLGYAQVHPAEDFAETFAIWLDPASRWRDTYRGQPALHKLQAINSILDEATPFPGVRPFLLRRPLEALGYSLKAHYERKLRLYGWSLPAVTPHDLRSTPGAFKWAVRGPSPEQSRKISAMLSRSTGLPALTSSALIADVLSVASRMNVESRTNKSVKLPISALDGLVALAIRKISNLRPGIPV